MLRPSCYYRWRGLPSDNLLIETLPKIAEHRGQWEKHLQLYALTIQHSGGKWIWIIRPEISNLSEDPTIIAGEWGPLYFATNILQRYLRDQGVGLSDMVSSTNDQINLTKIPKQAGSGQWSVVEVRDKFEQIFNSPSESVPWQNKRVTC